MNVIHWKGVKIGRSWNMSTVTLQQFFTTLVTFLFSAAFNSSNLKSNNICMTYPWEGGRDVTFNCLLMRKESAVEKLAALSTQLSLKNGYLILVLGIFPKYKVARRKGIIWPWNWSAWKVNTSLRYATKCGARLIIARRGLSGIYIVLMKSLCNVLIFV